MSRSRVVGLLLPLLAACGGDDSGGGDFYDAPPNDGPPTAPSDPPPTGSKWMGVEVTGECGRTKLEFVLVDEVCGGTEDPAYMDYFHAPIMRDGAMIGTDLFAVDATYLWVLDTTDPEDIQRKALLAGFGQPLAVATHAGMLLIASGDEGLLVVDPSDPTSPTRVATIDVAGPALDVFVEGDRAFVATGAGGVTVVDLVTQAVDKVLDVPGFAAAVAARNGLAYVAACNTFAIIDVTTGALVGQTWVENHTQQEILVAPAKDVALEGDVAFVAAGRYGAVAIDIAAPAAPSVLGNCTEQTDLSFYASGVRQEGDNLFIAGGEWGIKPVDIANPALSCTTEVLPALPPFPTDGEECTTEPPWEVMAWTETWTPPPAPPEGRDPIQTLPLPNRVVAFGDATRIGLRAIDIRDTTDLLNLPKLGRYAEPRLTEGIVAQGDRVLLAGKRGGLYRLVDEQLVLEQDLLEAKTARGVAFLGDGRWVLGAPNPDTGGGTLHIEGAAPIEVPETIWAGGIAAKADTIYVPVKEGVLAIDVDGDKQTFYTGREAQLPQSIAVADDHLLVAAPEWVDAIKLTPSEATPLGENGVFEEDDFYDVGLWHRALPRRILLETEVGAVEVASLGGGAGVTAHGLGVSATLPAGDYIAGTTDGGRLFAVATDRGRYRTMLVTVAFSSAPTVTDVKSFTGMATAITTAGGKLFLADGDRGVRVYDITSGTPVAIDILELGAQP